jgi:hypothetical protein
VLDLKVLEAGIPDVAYKPLSGDDKEATKIAGRNNRVQREAKAQHDLALAQNVAGFARAARAVSAMPEDDVGSVRARALAYEAVQTERGWWATKTACDLYVAAFLAPKRFRTGALERARTPDRVPTTIDVRSALAARPTDHQLVAKALDLAGAARALHWPLEFPAIMAAGGFDVVLGNPPWERIKLQEQEFFAARDLEIAQAPNAAAREQLIAKLSEAAPGTRERALYEEFEAAKRAAEAASVFARVEAEDCGRFPLTGRGDVNTYALFAELFATVVSNRGRAGVIVPTGIATDATTAPFFAALVESKRLARIISFENEEFIFPSVHHSYRFCLLTIGTEGMCDRPVFAFFLRNPDQRNDAERNFTLSKADIARINPNTNTAPVFRSRADAELTAKIYARVPVLIDKTRGTDGNPWSLSFHTRIWHMAEDSEWFRTAAQLAGFVRDGNHLTSPIAMQPREGALAPVDRQYERGLALQGGPIASSDDCYVPLYEAKMIHQFDHRWATYDNGESRDVTEAEKADPAFDPTPRYWVPEREVANRLAAKGWTRGWLIGWRDITSAILLRTVAFCVIPRTAVGHTCPLAFPQAEPRLVAALLGNLNSLSIDFVARLKVGGTHLTYGYLEQLPVIPPALYTPIDLAFLIPRVLELTYTSHSMTPFARDLGYDGPPFKWDEDRRAHLRAGLDAFYARAYGLSRDELRYILDPADVKGADYPSETFRVLKKNEIAKYGEYRTARLVLQAWDHMQSGEQVAAE